MSDTQENGRDGMSAADEFRLGAVHWLGNAAGTDEMPSPGICAQIGIGYALLAIEERLANQSPPVYVLNSTDDPGVDRETLEQLSEAIDRGRRGTA